VSIATDAPRENRVQSVVRALDLLEALMDREEVGLVELAERTGLQPSTAHRLLATLARRGYVFQNRATGRYLLSYRVLELAGHVQRRTARLRAAARPYLERARKVSGETANLVVLNEHDEIVYVDQVEGPRAMRMFMETGRSVPAHSAGAGKALLAARAPEALERLREQEPLRAFTPRTLTTTADLLRDLARIRRRGFSIDNEEHEVGVTCVAAPVHDHTGEAVAAISVSGPTPRMRATGLAELGELLVILTDELSAELGRPGRDAPAR
jgi:IclR family acetate operon transcriptional repressor